MDSKTLRQKFLDFFEKNDHVIIPSASLVPTDEEQLEGKEKVLFTTAGMQPFIPYLMGKPHPKGKKLADVQKCLRTDDIEEVGDVVHHTFFEMLGNWSLGDYWKEGAIELSFKFLTGELKIPLERLAISVFAGDDDAPRDEQSANKWKELGIPEKRIAYLGKEANWWPSNPSSIGPCGPDTEMFVWTGEESAPEEFDPKDLKWVEVWNDVFMEFNRKADGTLEELPQKNVDTGMGLERMLTVLQNKQSVYETDVFQPLISAINSDGKSRGDRILLDHLRAAIMIIAEGVEPSNKDRGYVLRRLIRRAIVKAEEIRLFKIDETIKKQAEQHPLSSIVESLVNAVVEIYHDTYPFLESKSKIVQTLKDEIERFGLTVGRGLRQFEKLGPAITAKSAFDLYQTFGFPIELTIELAKEKKWTVDTKGFEDEFKKHQEISKKGLEQKFAGGLAGHSEKEIKYHTATHLLHQALRDVLGPTVFQKGSNITSERLRFDFSFDRKMTPEEIKKVEDLINKRIDEDLKVDHMIIPLDEAKKMNAIGQFMEKYANKVSIYGVGPGCELDPEAKDKRERGSYYSLEFCGGPHVEHTGVIGRIKITKEESISSGIRRIRAEIVLN